jgi:hypothetical protein
MLQPTSQKIEVKNYPYGRKRTSMFFSVEFKPNKGFRGVTQSINPATGKLNKPHNGIYHKIMLLDQTEGFCKFQVREFYHIEKLAEVCQWLSANFALFTTEERKFLYAELVSFLRLEVYATVAYCGANQADVIKVIDQPMKKAIEGLKNPDNNVFNQITVDLEALEACKVKDYKPFSVKTYAVGA